MLLETDRESPPVKRSSLSVEKQTLTVGSVAVLIAFFLGLAFNAGGKSTSIDSLANEVNAMRISVNTLSNNFNASDKDTGVRIQHLEDKVTELTSKVDSLQNQAQIQAQAQNDYRAAGIHRR